MANGTKTNAKKSAKKSTKRGTSQNNDTKVLIWAVVIVVLLIVLSVSLTYAFFSRDIVRNGEDPVTEIESAKLDVDFETTEYINNSNAFLIYDTDAYNTADKTVFTVKRSTENTVTNVYYNLQLIDIEITDNLKSSYFKWRLYETATVTADSVPLKEGTFDGFEGTTMDLYDTKIPLATNAIHGFTLIVWLSSDDEVNQTDLLKGSFSAKVQVMAVNN